MLGSQMLWQGSGDGSKGDSLLQIVDCFLFYFLLVDSPFLSSLFSLAHFFTHSLSTTLSPTLARFFASRLYPRITLSFTHTHTHTSPRSPHPLSAMRFRAPSRR